MLDKLLKYSNNNSLYINKIIPNAKPCIGLYTNEIKAIAKEMVKEEKYSFFREKHEIFEEDMIHGFMIGYIKDWDYAFEEFKKYINLIDNWAMCDQIISNFKLIKKHKSEVKHLIYELSLSNEEYKQRVLFVILLFYFVEEDNVDYIFSMIKNVKINGYYSKMAVSWLLCECVIKQREYSLLHFNELDIDPWIINKAISKMNDSFRITKEDKEMLKKYRK